MPRNTKENAELTRQRLLDVAQQLFAQNGISGTSLENIASKAQVTRGAIYWHFRDKQHLLQELYLRIQPQIDKLRQSLADDLKLDPALALWRYIHRILLSIENDESMRLVASIVMLRDEGKNQRASALHMDASRQKELLNILIKILNDAKNKNQLQQDINVHHAGIALQATMRGIVFMRLALPENFGNQCEVTDLLPPYFRGVFKPEVWEILKKDKDY